MIPVSQSRLVTAPATEMLSVAEVKNHLRVDDNADDSLIAVLITVATQRLEAHTDRKFISQTWDVFFQGFATYGGNKTPWWDGTREGSIGSLYNWTPELVMPFGPMQSNSPTDLFLRYYTEDGTGSIYDPANYTVDCVGPRGRIVLKTGSVWPQDILRRTNGVRVTAVYGYGLNVADVPPAIKQAILLTVAKFYENRGDDGTGEQFTIPNTAQMLLAPYVHYKVGC